MDSTLVFTPAALLEILTNISELDGYSIGLVESLDGQYQLQIGDSIYELDATSSDEIAIDDSIIDQIEDINVDTYEELSSEGIIDDQEFISGGLLKEAVKSLLLGGAIRFASKLVG